MVRLARDAVDAVDIDRALRVLLVDRQIARPAVLLAGGGEDDAHRGVVAARTAFGGSRIIPLPLGEQLPRIC